MVKRVFRIFVPNLLQSLGSNNSSSPKTQDVNWTHIGGSKDVKDVYWTSYVCSVYLLCQGARRTFIQNEDNNS